MKDSKSQRKLCATNISMLVITRSAQKCSRFSGAEDRFTFPLISKDALLFLVFNFASFFPCLGQDQGTVNVNLSGLFLPGTESWLLCFLLPRYWGERSMSCVRSLACSVLRIYIKCAIAGDEGRIAREFNFGSHRFQTTPALHEDQIRRWLSSGL
jgi:hypothetical protein